jgi:hypothetical protein
MKLDVLPSLLTLQRFKRLQEKPDLSSIVSDMIQYELKKELHFSVLSLFDLTRFQDRFQLPLNLEDEFNSVVSKNLGFFLGTSLIQTSLSFDEILIFMDIVHDLLHHISRVPPLPHQPNISLDDLLHLKLAVQISISHNHSKLPLFLKSHVGPSSWDLHRMRLQILKFPSFELQKHLTDTLEAPQRADSEGDFLQFIHLLVHLFNEKTLSRLNSRFALFDLIILQIGRLMVKCLSYLFFAQLYSEDLSKTENSPAVRALVENQIRFVIRFVSNIRSGIHNDDQPNNIKQFFNDVREAINKLGELKETGKFPDFVFTLIDLYKIGLKSEHVILARLLGR